jgi:hypothetical protein
LFPRCHHHLSHPINAITGGIRAYYNMLQRCIKKALSLTTLSRLCLFRLWHIKNLNRLRGITLFFRDTAFLIRHPLRQLVDQHFNMVACFQITTTVIVDYKKNLSSNIIFQHTGIITQFIASLLNNLNLHQGAINQKLLHLLYNL